MTAKVPQLISVNWKSDLGFPLHRTSVPVRPGEPATHPDPVIVPPHGAQVKWHPHCPGDALEEGTGLGAGSPRSGMSPLEPHNPLFCALKLIPSIEVDAQITVTNSGDNF